MVRAAAAIGRQRAVWLSVLMVSTAITSLIPAPPVLAQISNPVVVQAAPMRFDIPAQPLVEALIQFGRQAGLQVSTDNALVQGRQTNGVNGAMTREQALTTLLSGTGLAYRITGTMVALEAQATPGVVTLGPVTVEGQESQERAKGPVHGYVAKRSATATKTDTPLIETPQSISVVPRDQIETQKPRTVAEALRYTPGVRTEANGAQAVHDGLILRGFTQFSGNLYQDGMRRGTTDYFGYDLTEPYALERIEVLRGPASVLYGLNSPGGMVNSITKRPTSTPLREVQLQGGSFDRKQVAADVGGPLEGGKFGYRLTALGRDADSQVDYTKDNRHFFAGAFSWNPSATTSFTLLTDLIKHDGAFNTTLPAVGSALSNPNGKIPSNRFVGDPSFDKMTNEGASLGYQFEHALEDIWTLRQNFRFRHLDVDRRFVRVNSLAADQRTINRATSVTFAQADVSTLDNQAEAKFATAGFDHTLLMGLDHYGYRIDQRTGGTTVGVPALDLFNPIYGQSIAMPAITANDRTTLRQIGLYLQDQIKFDNQWVLTVGGRHDWANSKIANRLTNANAYKDDEAFTGRAGLVYLSEIGLAPYVSYSESFLPVASTSTQIFKPETGQQYEAGVKYQPLGSNSFVAMSVFDLRRQNVTTTDPNNVNLRVQTGEVQSKGWELEGKASLTEGLNVLAAYTYADAEVTKSNGTDRGRTPTGVPAHMASLWTDYTFRSGSWSGFRFGVGARYVGKTFGDTTNTFTVPHFTLFDAEASYDLGQLNPTFAGARLALNGVNLADKEYASNCGSQTACQFGLRRLVLATLQYSW